MRLIDADALAKKIKALGEDYSDAEYVAHSNRQTVDEVYNRGVENGCAKALRYVLNAPTIEAEPVRHGRWVNMGGFPACSTCGTSPADWEAKPDNPSGFPPYCHGCGAKMDAKEDEGC